MLSIVNYFREPIYVHEYSGGCLINNLATGIVPKQPNVTQQSGNILIAWDNAVPDAQQYTIIQFKRLVE